MNFTKNALAKIEQNKKNGENLPFEDKKDKIKRHDFENRP